MKLGHCKYFQNAMGMLMQIKHIADTEREVTDIDMPEYMAWWKKSNFQNPFAGMKPDDFEALI